MILLREYSAFLVSDRRIVACDVWRLHSFKLLFSYSSSSFNEWYARIDWIKQVISVSDIFNFHFFFFVNLKQNKFLVLSNCDECVTLVPRIHNRNDYWLSNKSTLTKHRSSAHLLWYWSLTQFFTHQEIPFFKVKFIECIWLEKLQDKNRNFEEKKFVGEKKRENSSSSVTYECRKSARIQQKNSLIFERVQEYNFFKYRVLFLRLHTRIFWL